MRNNKKRVSALMSSVAAAALAMSMAPAAAFAAVGTDGTVYYTLPSASSVKSLDHTDATGSYQYLTLGQSTVGTRLRDFPEAFMEFLGVNYTITNTGLTNKPTVTNGTVTQSILGIMGTSLNENPDEYVYNYCCWLNGANVSDSMRINTSTNSTQKSPAIQVTIGGTDYANFPREVYMECNVIKSADATSSYGDSTWTKWIELENQRSGRPHTTEYDPYFSNWDAEKWGGAYTTCEAVYGIASDMDKVIADSKDSKGNYTVRSRYADGPNTTAIAQTYEDVAKGTMYYVMSKIADKTVSKKTVAIVDGYDPQTGYYACRKFEVTDPNVTKADANDPNANYYGGRFANYAVGLANNITDTNLAPACKAYSDTEDQYVTWYTPDQIVQNADAVFCVDASGSNTVSTYLASAPSNGIAYGPTETVEVNGTKVQCVQGLLDAQTSAKNAGKKAADIDYKYPKSILSSYFAQNAEHALLAPMMTSFLYPEIMDLTDAIAFWARDLWHISASSVQEIVSSTCAGISLSANQTQIGEVKAGYEQRMKDIYNAGNWYYLSNTEAIDAIDQGNFKTHDLDALKARTTKPVQAQTIKVSPASKVIKYAAAKKAKKTVAIKVTGAKTALTATPTAAAKKAGVTAKVNSKAKVTITLKKGIKKGTYKVAVQAKKTSAYTASKAVNVTIKVK